MTKPNNFPREKDRALPWSKGLPIFNTATGRYEKPTRKSSVARPSTEPRPKSSRSATSAVAAGNGLHPRPASSEHPGDKKRKRGAGVSFVPPKRRRFVRQKNGGLPDDFPTVLFPGEPMAIAVKKTEELKEEFPGEPLRVALEKKKRAGGGMKTTTTTTTTTKGRKEAAAMPRRMKPAGDEEGKGVKPGGRKRKVEEVEEVEEKRVKAASGPKRPKFNMAEFLGRKG